MKVLLVDADARARTELKQELEGWRWDVAEADGLPDALSASLAGVDLVAIDQLLPHTTGLEVARELRARGCTAPILLFCGLLSPNARADSASLGIRTLSKADRRAVLRVLSALAASSTN